MNVIREPAWPWKRPPTRAELIGRRVGDFVYEWRTQTWPWLVGCFRRFRRALTWPNWAVVLHGLRGARPVPSLKCGSSLIAECEYIKDELWDLGRNDAFCNPGWQDSGESELWDLEIVFMTKDELEALPEHDGW